MPCHPYRADPVKISLKLAQTEAAARRRRQLAIEQSARRRYTRRRTRSSTSVPSEAPTMPRNRSMGDTSADAGDNLAAKLLAAPDGLAAMARWVPPAEMALLTEICERARREPALLRPALLLSLGYAKKVARLLDQDPLPRLSEEIEAGLRRLREKDGL
jgi:hypothetical protein